MLPQKKRWHAITRNTDPGKPDRAKGLSVSGQTRWCHFSLYGELLKMTPLSRLMKCEEKCGIVTFVEM